MAIISNNRPFKGINGAEKIHSGTDDGIMQTGLFPFDFYYDGFNIKNGVRFSGNTFAYLTTGYNIEEIRVNRRDAICKGLYREDNEDYVRIAWIGYSHYSTSNQIEANRLEWEVYFFKGTSIIEVVIGKSPQTSNSIDYFDTKGGVSFNGPFAPGCSYVFEGDERGKNHITHVNSHYQIVDYIERDVAIIDEEGNEKKVYPTAIASNTLVEQDNGSFEKLSDVLKNLKGGGGDYEFLPVKPREKFERAITQDGESNVENQITRINPFISCSTEDRPIVEDVGFQIYDTDLRAPVWWDGEKWNPSFTIGGQPPSDDDDSGEGDNPQDFHMYRADIYSTNGTIFRNGDIKTVLQARLYDFDRNITKDLHPSQYKWTRISKDEEADVIWDNQHSQGSYEIEITAADVRLRAVFYLDVVDENGYSILNSQVSTGN